VFDVSGGWDITTGLEDWDYWLNLSHNFFASLRGFGYLPNLRILKIKQNRLESLFCKLNDDGYPRGLFGLHGLEVLDVSYNSLHDLYGI
jgi:Leucine-rich repeat (LRR) protein